VYDIVHIRMKTPLKMQDSCNDSEFLLCSRNKSFNNAECEIFLYRKRPGKVERVKNMKLFCTALYHRIISYCNGYGIKVAT